MLTKALKLYSDELDQCSDGRVAQYARHARTYHILNILATGAVTAYFWRIGAMWPFQYTAIVLALLSLRAASLLMTAGRAKSAFQVGQGERRKSANALVAFACFGAGILIFWAFLTVNSPAMVNATLVSVLLFIRGITVLVMSGKSSDLLSSREFLKSGLVYNFALCFYIGIGTAIFARQLALPGIFILVLWCLLNALGSGIVSSSITRLAGYLTLVATLPFVFTFPVDTFPADFHFENSIMAALVFVLSILTFSFVHDHRKSFQETEKQRIKEETAKEKAQDMLQSFMSVAKDWAWEIDRDLKLTYVSPNFEKINGVPKETVLGVCATRILDDVIIPESRADAEYIKKRLQMGSGIDDVNLHVRLGSGEDAWLQMHAHAIYSESGSFDGFRGWMSDVSGLVRASQATENSNLMLEKKVRQRTQELERKTAEHKKSRDEAQEANAVKTKFLANISHEIRTPMNGIVGLCELLGRGDIDTVQREYVQTIHSSATALMRIINEILDMSKLSAAKMKLNRTNTDLRCLLRQVISVLQYGADEKGLIIRTEVKENIQPMMVDEGRIRQILINLIGNAVKFTGAGEICVSIDFVSIGSKQKILIKVRDTGIGIPQDKMSLVFEDFVQVSEGTTKYHQGTGLGLSICRKLVSLMGGHIGVRSREGVGSVFWFRISGEIADAAPPAVAQGAFSPDTNNSNEGMSLAIETPLKILIAEDNAVNVMVLTTFLKSVSEDVIVRINGKEAYTKFINIRPDVIFMDVSMPEMDGREATRAIRAHEMENHLPRTPIIGCTAHADPDEQKACLDVGMDLVITKPIDSRKVTQALARI